MKQMREACREGKAEAGIIDPTMSPEQLTRFMKNPGLKPNLPSPHWTWTSDVSPTINSALEHLWIKCSLQRQLLTAEENSPGKFPFLEGERLLEGEHKDHPKTEWNSIPPGQPYFWGFPMSYICPATVLSKWTFTGTFSHVNQCRKKRISRYQGIGKWNPQLQYCIKREKTVTKVTTSPDQSLP